MSEAASNESSSIGRRRALARRERNTSWLERRAQVLTAAADALRAKGYQAMSMSDIAQRVGGDRATVYYYFASKQEIFLGLVEQAVRENAETVERIAAAEEPAVERLRQVIESLAESYQRHYPYLHLYVQEDMRRLSKLDSPEHRQLRELGQRYDRAVIQLAEQGVRSGEFRAELDPRLLKFAVLGALNWMHRWYVPDGRLTGAEIGRAFSDLFVHGVIAATPRPDPVKG